MPMVVNAIALWPEATTAVPSLNDDMLHFLFIQRASEVLAEGGSVLDFWMPNIEAGFPQFFYYQHLPALATVGIHRLTGGEVDLLTTMNLIRFVLMVGFPLTVLLAMRWMGFPLVVAVMGAAASSLLSGDGRYGFDYDSYVWRGWGMYTQLWAMHLAFLTIGASVRAIHRGKGIWLAGLLLGVLLLTHLLYTYMTVMTLMFIAVWGISRRDWASRLLRLVAIGGSAAVISAYMWLPLLTNTAYLNASPYLQSWKYDSLGADAILRALFTGDLFDHGRVPVLTVLLAIGVVLAIIGRIRPARLFVALLALWLVLWFGRPTWGSAMDLLPLSDGLLLHRFAGLVYLAAIVVMGIGGAVLWWLMVGSGTTKRIAAATVITLFLLIPALGERWDYYDDNTDWLQRSAAILADDADAQAVLARLRELPPGRIYAGLPDGYGGQMKLGDLSFANVLVSGDFETVAPPSESLSLSSDLIWHFNEQELADHALWGVRYVIAPVGQSLPAALRPILTTSRYVLYEVPAASYGTFAEITARAPARNQAALFAYNRAWQQRGEASRGRFLRVDFPAADVGPGPLAAPGCPEGTIPYESFRAGLIRFVVDCPNDSTFVIKTSYHPNWQVTIDGQAVEDFMVSPAFIGVSVPAGRHALTATYVAAPIKQPLAIVGLLWALALLLLRGRFDRFTDRVAGRVMGRFNTTRSSRLRFGARSNRTGPE